MLPSSINNINDVIRPIYYDDAIGLQSIMNTAAKLHGNVAISHDGGEFCISIILTTTKECKVATQSISTDKALTHFTKSAA